MRTALAKTISMISSPFVVLFVFGLWTMAALAHSVADFLLWGILFTICTIGFPLTYILIGLRSGRISDIHVAVREQRGTPFLLATLGSLILTAIYYLLDTPQKLIALGATLVVCGALFGLISAFWKISMHSAAYTGSVVIVASIINTRLLWLLILLPLITWARYERRRHDLWQGLVAALLVAGCVVVTLGAFS